MRVHTTPLEGVLVVEPKAHRDPRGFFLETYQARRYEQHGICGAFVQDNLSHSQKDTLRGLHYQYPHGQAKLVSVIKGAVFDVAVDVRRGSPTFGQWTGVELSAQNHRQLFVPAWCAHGFCVLSDDAVFTYKCSDYYAPEAEHGIAWNDPDLAIAWPVTHPVQSAKDAVYPRLRDVAAANLPGGQTGNLPAV